MGCTGGVRCNRERGRSTGGARRLRDLAYAPAAAGIRRVAPRQRSAAATSPEDGSGGTADWRDRARFQQSAYGDSLDRRVDRSGVAATGDGGSNRPRRPEARSRAWGGDDSEAAGLQPERTAAVRVVRSLSARGRVSADAAPGASFARRGAAGNRSHRLPYQYRSGGTGADPSQSRDQRARRHAGGGQAAALDRSGAAGSATRQPPGMGTGRHLYRAAAPRLGVGNGTGGAGADLRAVLYHKAAGSGHRLGDGDGVRTDEAARRIHRGAQHAGRRDLRDTVFPTGPGTARADT